MAKARGIGGYAKKDVRLSREGWVVTGYVEKDGWLRREGCVGTSRGMGG